MKKIYLIPALAMGLLMTSRTQAQIDMNKNNAENDVTITMDLQPILELQMTTPDQIDFVFDNINSYMAGIAKYGATVLKVSSSVDWDLAAVATSNTYENAAGSPYWDNPIAYSTNGRSTIPLSVLELQQIPRNPSSNAANPDNYNRAFAAYPGNAITASNNAIEIGRQAGGTSITFGNNVLDNKMLVGVYSSANAAPGDNTNGYQPGSYLNNTNASYSAANFRYTVSYRLLPGLPALFPFRDADEAAAPVGIAAGEYAAPGVYTMEVRYILTEDQ